MLSKRAVLLDKSLGAVASSALVQLRKRIWIRVGSMMKSMFTRVHALIVRTDRWLSAGGVILMNLISSLRLAK